MYGLSLDRICRLIRSQAFTGTTHLAGDRMEGDDVRIFIDEFKKELEGQSDRGLVVVGAAGLDVVLESLLSVQLNDEIRREDMFGSSNGPLGEFGSRIKVAAALGLISRDERRELGIVRRIRNEAAHKVNVNLSSGSLRDLCMALKLGVKLYYPEVIPLADLPGGSKGIPDDLSDPDIALPVVDLEMPGAGDPRERFAATVQVLLRSVWARTFDVPDKRTPPPEFVYPEDPTNKALIQTSRTLGEMEANLEQMKDIRDQLRAHGFPTDDEDRGIVEVEPLLYELRRQQKTYEYFHEVVRRSRNPGEQA